MCARGLIVLAFVATVSCTGNDRASSSVDTWHSPPPADLQFTPVQADAFAPVAEPLQAEAQAALAERSALRVPPTEAERLAGRRLPAGAEYVLLRALVLDEGNGGFGLGVSGQAVHVHHGSLGTGPRPMRRKALIAVLASFPETVFVSCSMAQ